MLVGASSALIVRLLVGGTARIDFEILFATIVLIGPVEWVLHKFLLHAAEDSFQMRRLGTGIGHRQHHLTPGDLNFVLLGGIDAALFLVLIAAWTAIWTLPFILWAGGAVLGPYLTGLTAAFLALVHYEWVHMLVHTRVRLKNRFYKRLAANHRLHHFRNENYWLGVTANSGDRVLRTYPKTKGDVPLSPTARSLTP